MVKIPGPENIERVPAGVMRTNQPRMDVASAGDIGRGVSAVGEGVGQISDALGRAAAKIQARDDTIKFANSIVSFDTQALELEQAYGTADAPGDITDPRTGQQFTSDMENLSAKVLNEFGGSPDIAAKLEATIIIKRSGYVSRLAATAFDAQVGKVSGILNKKKNEGRAAVYASPGRLMEEIQAYQNHLDLFADALPAEKQAGFVRGAVSEYTEVALQSFIDRGEFGKAEELLLHNDTVSQVLDAEAQKRLFTNIKTARQGKSGDIVKGMPRDIFESLSEEDQRRVLGAAPSEKLVKIADETSPTGVSLVPESEAKGKPAPANAPVVSITEQGETSMAKQLGKLDADRVSRMEDSAQKAFRDKGEIDRMRTAIESGGFKTGVFSSIRVFIGRLADFTGVDIGDLDSVVGDAAIADTLDAASQRLAVGIVQRGGRMTSLFLKTVQDSLPNLMRTPDGNLILLEVMDRVANREIETATLADNFIQEHGTLRPEGQRTFFQAVRDLEEDDPVITPELRKRIAEGSKTAPKSWRDVMGIVQGTIKGEEPPAGVEIPKGFEYTGKRGKNLIIRRTGDGQSFEWNISE